jgi:hypothetical protein
MIDKLNFEFMQLNMPIEKLISSKTDIDKSKQLVDEISLLEKEKSMRERLDELRKRIKVIENLPGESLTSDMERYLTDLDGQLEDLLAEHDKVIRFMSEKGLVVSDLEAKKRELSEIYNKCNNVVRAPAPSAGNPGAGGSGAGNPGAGGPGAGNPGAGNPGAGNPGARGPGAGGSEPKMDATGDIYADLNRFNYFPSTTESTFSYVKRIIEDDKEKLIYKTESIEPYLNNPEKHLVKFVKDMCKDKDLRNVSKNIPYDNRKSLEKLLSNKRALLKQMRSLSAEQQIYKYVALKSAVTPQQIAEALKSNYIYDYNINIKPENPNIFRGAYRFLTGKEIPILKLANNSLTTKKDNSFLERYRAKHRTYSYAPREQTKSKDKGNVER